MPQMIDGTPLRMSAAKRIHQLSRDEPYSERYTPPSTPTGTPSRRPFQQNERPDDGVGHAAAGFADRFGQFGEKAELTDRGRTTSDKNQPSGAMTSTRKRT